MTGEFEYLEKYSVAPAPSRDYYGIRILRDEVKLFLWKISHGPHKTPQVRAAKFADFLNDKSLQDEIHRVFGTNVLNYVSDFIAGKTKNSEDNLSGLSRGWTRVFKEGQEMQRSTKTTQCDKKRCVKSRVPSTGVKVNASSKPRAKFSSKTPLEVIKTINTGVKKNPPNFSTLSSANAGTSATSRQVIEVSEKITRTKVTKVTEESKKSREVKSDRQIETRTKIDSEYGKIKRIPASSKSTILKTDKSLITGSSSVARKNVDLTELIREEAKERRERPSIFDTYFSRMENNERSTGDKCKSREDSSSGNYEIENSWSSNSSIVSVSSPSEVKKIPTKCERSYLTDKYKSARQSVVKKENSVVENKALENRSRRNEAISNPRAGTSAAKRLDNIERLTALGRRSENFGSFRDKLEIAGVAKNRPISMEKRSNSNMEIGDSRRK